MKQRFIAIACVLLLMSCGGKKVGEPLTETDVIHTVDVSTFDSIIANSSVLLLDVRTAEEYQDGHLEGAINIDVNSEGFVDSVLSYLSPIHSSVAVYCKGGKRSLKAASMLSTQDKEIYNLDGGIMAWNKSKKE